MLIYISKYVKYDPYRINIIIVTIIIIIDLKTYIFLCCSLTRIVKLTKELDIWVVNASNEFIIF